MPAYYIFDEEQQSGPFEIAQITGMWNRGSITANAQSGIGGHGGVCYAILGDGFRNSWHLATGKDEAFSSGE